MAAAAAAAHVRNEQILRSTTTTISRLIIPTRWAARLLFRQPLANYPKAQTAPRGLEAAAALGAPPVGPARSLRAREWIGHD